MNKIFSIFIFSFVSFGVTTPSLSHAATKTSAAKKAAAKKAAADKAAEQQRIADDQATAAQNQADADKAAADIDASEAAAKAAAQPATPAQGAASQTTKPSPTDTTQAPTSSPSTESAGSEVAPEGYGKTHGLLGEVLIGPTVGVGFPSPIAIGLEAKMFQYFDASLDYGFLPTRTISNASIALKNYALNARVFPFRGAFFIGTAVGKQALTGSRTGTVTIATVATDVTDTLTINTVYLTPKIGWRWVWECGLMVGMEFGWQLPLSSTSNVTSTAPAAVQAQADYLKLQSDLQDAGNKIGKTGLPHIALLQIGYFF